MKYKLKNKILRQKLWQNVEIFVGNTNCFLIQNEQNCIVCLLLSCLLCLFHLFKTHGISCLWTQLHNRT